jgi:iron(III) transport system substrate-binding protein
MAHSKRSSIAAVGALTLVLAACGGTDSSKTNTAAPAGSAQLEELARDEGSVIVLGSTIPKPAQDALVSAMRDDYGVEVEWLQTTAPESLERLRAGQMGNEAGGDVLVIGAQYGMVAKEDGLLQSADFPSVDDWRFDADEEGYWFQHAAAPYGVLVNRDLVGPDWPTAWDDLAEETPFTEQMLMDDPSRGSVGFTWSVLARMDRLPIDDSGEDYLADIGAQSNFGFTASPPDARAQVVRGDIAALFPVGIHQTADIADALGSTVELVFPSGRPFSDAHNVGMIADAPHPNAAQLLLNLILSDEYQQMLADLGFVPGSKAIAESTEDHGYSVDQILVPLTPDELIEVQADVDTIVPSAYGR